MSDIIASEIINRKDNKKSFKNQILKNSYNISSNLKSSTSLKSKKSQKRKFGKNAEIINKKKVKFNNDVTIIDIESYKKYNVELTSGETINDSEKDNEIKKTKEKNKKNKREHISCVCSII